ncbi:DUF5104 domain-containing protein [uncultured Oscillibacter sp.]|uniref:DUF5104 domain-containing protein n=1 Tax=uncultured Oscillibacter sp. TaxID=876091 RepID=UPI00261B72DE|nr:DUF5104 domain-containing protein [uncultured Oscillibacter sp.]
MKKTAPAVLLGLLLLLTGCGLVQRTADGLSEGLRDAALGALEGLSGSRWSLQDPIDEFFAAVDARDAEAVRALFSPNVREADGDLDESIQALLDLYPGPTEDCEMLTPVGASKHLEYGRQTMVDVHNSLPAVCGGVNYYCSFSYVTKDEEDPGNVGLRKVVVATEAARCHPDYYQNSLDLEDGLSVVTAPAAEGETRRIGDEPFAFTPYDRTVTREELPAFLETDDSWEGFTARFGPPNAEGWLGTGYYYELVPEDGQARYVHIYTHDFGDGARRVWSVYLYNGRDSRELETVWKNPKGEET